MDASLRTLREALAIRRQIYALEKRLSSVLGGQPSRAATRERGRRMSPATRAKLAAAARARWAKIKAGEKTTLTRKKGGITRAGRKRLSQLMKARWASLHGVRDTRPPPPPRRF